MSARIWTIVFQTVNFLILVWLLRRFLYRPVLNAIDKRRAETERVVRDAKAASEAAAKLQRDLTHQRDGIESERTHAIESAQAKAEDEREALLDTARQESIRFQKAALEEIARERAEADIALREQAGAVAVDLAHRLLASVAPETIPPAMERRLLAELRGMSAEQRRRLVSGNREIETVTTNALTAADQERLRTALEEIFGQPLPIRFTADQSLLAGLELRFSGGILRDNWRDSLASAAHELAA